MTLRMAALVAASTIPATAVAQEAGTPRGTYLVYAEADGVAFASYEPALAGAGRWPMVLFFYGDGQFGGAARATTEARCAAGEATARITDLLDEAGRQVPLPSGQAAPPISFTRASNSAGDAAIVDFLCGDASSRLAQSSAPIFGTPAETARRYVAMRAAGLGDRLARDIAIRDPEDSDALIGTAVPEELRDRVRAILDARD